MWTPKREEREKKYYDGAFPSLDLVGNRFHFPEQLLNDFRLRNTNMEVEEFYAFPINIDGVRCVSLFDPTFIDADKSGRLKKDQAHIMMPDQSLFVEISDYIKKYLSLLDKIAVEGHNEVVRLWNPCDFLEYSETSGVEFRGDLTQFQRDSYRYLKGL